jgi:hypothetical protein
MTQIELIDKAFIFLSTMEEPYIFPSALQNKLDIQNANPIMLLETLHDIGFAGKEKNTQQSLGASQTIYNYWINSQGKQFIESLPAEFSQNPYTFLIQQKNSDKNLTLEKANLEIVYLRNKVFDYDETKRRAKWGMNFAVIAIVISALALLSDWMCNKSD